MTTALPQNANLEFYKKQAKKLVKAGEVEALHHAQLQIAEEHGFKNWANFKSAIEAQSDTIKAFVNAVRSKDSQAVIDVVKQHPDLEKQLDGPWFDFDTPAVVFARKDLDLLDTLLSLGADINKKSEWWAGGFGVLDSDITNEDEEKLAQELIKRGATVDVHAASLLGDLDTLKSLIESNPALVHDKGGDGKEPLHWARTIEVASYLIEQGADINAKCIDHHSTPAEYLVVSHPEVVRYLIEQGCDYDILMATAVGDLDLVKSIIAKNPDAIYWAVSREYLELITPESGGSIYGWTLGFDLSLMQIAKKFGHDHVYDWLINNSPENLTFIAHCATKNFDAADKMLKANPDLIASLRPQDHMQLPNSAKDNDTEAVAYMCKIGFDINTRGQHGAPALHWSAFNGNLAMAKIILQYLPDLTIVDHDFDGPAPGWAVQGSHSGWHKDTGDFGGVLEALFNAGAEYHTWMYHNSSEVVKAKIKALGLPTD